MALTLNNLVGPETGGLEEAIYTSGSPDAGETTVVRTGDYSLKLTLNAEYGIAMITGGTGDGSGDYIVGFAIRFPGLSPGTPFIFLETKDDENAYLWYLTLDTDGDLIVRDGNGDLIATATSPFTVDTWHFIEVRWQHSDPGAFDLWVDGQSKVSETGQDLSAGNTISADAAMYIFRYSDTIYVSDIYCMSGASGTGDFLGDCEVFRYQADTASATPDTGDDIDYGSSTLYWQEVGTTPGDADEIGYAAYPTTGAVYTDDVESGKHYRHGPHGDANIDGTIKGAKFLHQLKGGGAGDYYKRYGNDGDGLTDAVATLTTAYVNHMTISELATVVPLATEHFAIGIKNLDQRKDLFCKGMWAFILHVPSAGTLFERAVSRTGAITASVVRTGSTYKREPLRTGSIVAALIREGSTYKREPVNTLSPTPSVTRKEIAVRAPARSGSISAAVDRKETAVRASSRSGSVSASVDRSGSTYKRAPSRSGAISASVAAIKKIIKVLSRSGVIAASVVRTGSTYLREVSRSGTITAVLSRGGSTYKRAVSRTGTITATVGAVVKLVRAASRSGAVTATVDRLVKYKRTLARTGAIAASVVRVETAVRALSRTGAITAVVVRTGSTYKREVSRTGAVVVSVAFEVLGVIQRALSRSGTIAATVSRAGSTYKREVSRVGTITAGVGKVLEGGAEAAKKLAYYPISLLPTRIRRKGRR